MCSHSAVVPLLYDTLHDASATVVESFRTDRFYTKRRSAWVARGDDVMRDLGLSSISTIKIDVEGNEGSVLQGLPATVQKFRPFVILEVLPISHISADSHISSEERSRIVECRKKNFAQIDTFIADFSYTPFRILSSGMLEMVADFDMEEFALEKCNYLLIPPGEGSFIAEFELPKL